LPVEDQRSGQGAFWTASGALFALHDVSILIETVGGRWRGGQTPSKISMMIMRPPQQGHGWMSASGDAWSPAVLSSASGAGADLGDLGVFFRFDPDRDGDGVRSDIRLGAKNGRSQSRTTVFDGAHPVRKTLRQNLCRHQTTLRNE